MVKKIVLPFIFFLFFSSTRAHPHVFITPRVAVFVEGAAVMKITVQWVFDAMTSAALREEIDKNNDGSIGAKETEKIRNVVFPALAEYNYYTRILFDKKAYERIKAGNFTITGDEEGRIIYGFIIRPINGKCKRMTIYFEDETIYTGFDFGREFVEVRDAGTGALLDVEVLEKEMDFSMGVEIIF